MVYTAAPLHRCCKRQNATYMYSKGYCIVLYLRLFSNMGGNKPMQYIYEKKLE